MGLQELFDELVDRMNKQTDVSNKNMEVIKEIIAGFEKRISDLERVDKWKDQK